MKFGFSLPTEGPMAVSNQIVRLAQQGEKLGFDRVMLSDHIVFPERVTSSYPYLETGEYPNKRGDSLEQLTTLSFLAAKTSTIRLMSSVMVLPYRNPLVAAKMLATIDVLSEGRLIVGVGSGWMEGEFEALRSPPFRERGRVADEYIRILKEVWTSDTPQFQGRYFSFPGVRFLPKPLQKPHPPIWVGGESPSALRRAAVMGNGWYPIGLNRSFPLRNADELRPAITRLFAYAREARRKPESLEIGYHADSNGLLKGDASEVASRIRSYEKVGVSYIGVSLKGRDFGEAVAYLEKFADIASKVSR